MVEAGVGASGHGVLSYPLASIFMPLAYYYPVLLVERSKIGSYTAR